jgi:hypothetical protein
MDAEDELRIDLRNTSPRGSAVVDDLLFAADGIGEVEAFLVRPATRAARPGAGVVWWHWLDTEAPDGDRTEFLEEAVGHAGDGTVSLLLQGRFPWKGAPSGSGADARQIADEVLRLRRGLDLLVARSDVDAARLAVVGHDFGGMLAILALAGDRRPKGAVILAPAPRWGDWCLPFWRIEEDRIDYLRGLRPFDPIERVAAIAPRPLLFQFAGHDFYLAPMVELEFKRAAGETAELKRYPGGHDLKVDAACDDRRAFLARILELSG